MNTKHLFEKFATPISIVVAGALIGGGIILAKGAPSSSSKVSTTESAPTNEADVIKAVTTLPILKKIGVKSKELETCITDGTTKAAVDNDIALGQKAGLRGTPHMIVMMKKDGKDIQFPLYGALDKVSIEKAMEMIELTIGEAEVGKIYKGVVDSVKEYGAFVEVGGWSGLVHVSEMSDTFVKDPSTLVKVGDEVDVLVKAVDDQGKVSLSMKGVKEKKETL